MIPVFKCACCNKDTQMYPVGTPVMEDKVEKVPLQTASVKEDGTTEISVSTVDRNYKMQKTRPLRQQNPFTGEIDVIQTGVFDYGTAEPTVQLQLRMGDETISRALCRSCYESKFKKAAEELFLSLENRGV